MTFFLTVNKVLVLFVAKICLFYLLSPKFFYANFYSLICILFILLSCDPWAIHFILSLGWILNMGIFNSDYKAMKDLQSTHTLAPTSLAETLINNERPVTLQGKVTRESSSKQHWEPIQQPHVGKVPELLHQEPHSTVCLLS